MQLYIQLYIHLLIYKCTCSSCIYYYVKTSKVSMATGVILRPFGVDLGIHGGMPTDATVNDFQWTFMNVIEYLRISLNIMNMNEYQWMPLHINENQWISMNIDAYKYLSIIMYDHLWLSKNIHVYLWTSMHVNEHQWTSMKSMTANAHWWI